MKQEIIISPLASILGIPQGAVPNHGFTTWIGPDIAGLRAVISILWHHPDVVEVKESILDTATSKQMLGRSSVLTSEQVLMLLHVHTTMTPNYVYTGPFTAPKALDHVQWLASHGLHLPEDNPHWLIACDDAPKQNTPDIISKVLNNTATPKASAPNFDLASIVKEAKGETAKSSPLTIGQGERPWVNVRQSRPRDGRVIEFFSKLCADETIECVFVEKDLGTGSVTELHRDKLSPGQLDDVLKKTAAAIFKNGETWIPIDL